MSDCILLPPPLPPLQVLGLSRVAASLRAYGTSTFCGEGLMGDVTAGPGAAGWSLVGAGWLAEGFNSVSHTEWSVSHT